MQIHGLHQAHATQSVANNSSVKSTAPAQVSESSQSAHIDQLDLSPEALAISQSQATETGGIRLDKVSALRQAIADGTYETPERLSAAIDKMLDTFA